MVLKVISDHFAFSDPEIHDDRPKIKHHPESPKIKRHVFSYHRESNFYWCALNDFKSNRNPEGLYIKSLTDSCQTFRDIEKNVFARADEQMDGRTDGSMDRLMDTQTDRQTSVCITVLQMKTHGLSTQLQAWFFFTSYSLSPNPQQTYCYNMYKATEG